MKLMMAWLETGNQLMMLEDLFDNHKNRKIEFGVHPVEYLLLGSNHYQ